MCTECDSKVHNTRSGNKVERSSIVAGVSSTPTQCDICQERPGHIFCMEDRAVLCVTCDHSIHTLNAHTQKHNRMVISSVSVSLKSGSGADCERSSTETSSAHACEAGQERAKGEVASGVPPGKKQEDYLDPALSAYARAQKEAARIDELLNVPGLASGYHLDDFGDFDTFDDNFDFSSLLDSPSDPFSAVPSSRKHPRYALPENSSDDCAVPEFNMPKRRRGDIGLVP